MIDAPAIHVHITPPRAEFVRGEVVMVKKPKPKPVPAPSPRPYDESH